MSDSIPNRLQRHRQLFEQALEIEEAAERADFLARECGDERELWQELQALLAAEEDSPTEFMAPQADFAPDPPTPGETPGTIIGTYTLLDPLGDGAFGVVWRAEQAEPVQREVALKIIKPGMDSSEVVARFEAERQALALMDHPSIAQVYDAGTTDLGRPYFVMELVRGVPITDYCTEQNLSIEARLRLFIEVCRAVQHAHQKGVIHRDLKPSNILVVEHGGKALPKVIDFGIAKAIDQELASRTLATLEGQFIGTPQYMSPEQTGLQGSDIDTRADVYALGAVLYELLTGSPPLTLEQLKAGGWGEMERLIREQEPAKPSVRTTTLDAGKTSRHLRGDLDWVVMRALEKDRDRRYDTANGFAEDLGRFLANEPVSAGPPTLGYRTRKFVRRNRGLVASLATIALVLLAAAVISSVLAVRARKAEDDARTAQSAESIAREAEAEKGRLVTRQYAEALVERAFQRAVDGDPGEALLWHLEALHHLVKANPELRLGTSEKVRLADAFAGVPPIEWSKYWGIKQGSIVFDPAEQWVTVISNGGLLEISHFNTGERIYQKQLKPGKSKHRLAVHPTGKFVAIHNGSEVIIYDSSSWDSPRATIPLEAEPSRVDFNHDGSLLAIIDVRGNVSIMETSSMNVVSTFNGGNLSEEGGNNYLCKFSPTNDQLVIALASYYNADRFVRCIDARSGEVILPDAKPRYTGYPDERFVFSPDGRYLAIADRLVIIWDLTSGAPFTRFTVGNEVRALQFHDDKVHARIKSLIEIWSIGPPSRRIGSIPVRNTGNDQIVGSADGQRFLAHAYYDGNTVFVGDSVTGSTTMAAKHSRSVNAAALSAAGDRMAILDATGVLRVGPAIGRKDSVRVLSGRRRGPTGKARLQCLDFTPDGQQVVGTTPAWGAEIWDSSTGEVLEQFRPVGQSNGFITGIQVTPDGRYLVIAERNGLLRVLDAQSRKEARRVDLGHKVIRLDMSPTQPLLIARGYGTSTVVDIHDGAVVAAFPTHAVVEGTATLLHPKGKHILGMFSTTGGDSGIKRRIQSIFDGRDSSAMIFKNARSWVPGHSARFSRDGRYVIAAQEVFLWEGKEIPKRLHRFGNTVGFSRSFVALAHDGKRAACVEQDGSVRVWWIEIGSLANPMIPPSARAAVAAFSGDDQWLAIGSSDGQLTVWEVATGRLVAGPVRVGSDEVYKVIVNPRCLQILATDTFGKTVLWDLSNELIGSTPLADLRTAAEILTNRRIDENGKVVVLEREELESRWNGMNETVRALVTRKSTHTGKSDPQE